MKARGIAVAIMSSAVAAALYDALVRPSSTLVSGVSLPIRVFVSVFLLILLGIFIYASFAYRQKTLVRAFGQKSLLLSAGTVFALTIWLLWLASAHVSEESGLRDALVLGAALYGVLVALCSLALGYVRVSFSILQAATTATAVILSPASGGVRVLLVFNERFGWWLVPGGHFDWSYGESPQETAESRALSEAGVYVDVVAASGAAGSRQNFSQLQHFAGPHFLYWLDVPVGTCHAKHLDFSFVFSLRHEVKNHSKHRMWVELPDLSYGGIDQALRKSIRAYHNSLPEFSPPSSPYPEDLPYRILNAIRLWQTSRSEPGSRQPDGQGRASTPSATRNSSSTNGRPSDLEKSCYLTWDPRAGRVFVSTALSCPANCSFCYTSSLVTEPTPYASEDLGTVLSTSVLSDPRFVPGKDGTAVMLGGFSDPLQRERIDDALEVISTLGASGNIVHLATRFTFGRDLERAPLWSRNVVVNYSISTLEPGVEFGNQEDRFIEARTLIERGGIVALYVRPVLPGLTLRDTAALVERCLRAGIRYVTVGGLYVDDCIVGRLEQHGVTLSGVQFLDKRLVLDRQESLRKVRSEEVDLVSEEFRAAGLRVFSSSVELVGFLRETEDWPAPSAHGLV